MKYRHYAPRAKVHILGGADEVAKLRFLTDAIREGTIGAYPAFYLSQEICEGAERILSSEAIRYEIITFVSEESHHNAASGLFAAFRSFDRLNVTDIWAEEQPLSSLGTAYMNRLTKAAGAI